MVLNFRRAVMSATLCAALSSVAPAQERAWLGFTVDSTSRALVVRRVALGSPARRAGLMPGDTIVSIDKITDRAAQLDRIRELDDGMSVTLQVRRGRPQPTTITLVARPASASTFQQFGWNDSALYLQLDSASQALRRLLDTARVQSDAKWLLRSQDSVFKWGNADSLLLRYRYALGDSGAWNDLSFATNQRSVSGAEMTPLEAPLTEYLGVSGGLLIVHVTPHSAAARAGLKAGDVISTIDGAPATSVAQFRKLTRGKGRTGLVLMRNHVRTEVQLTPDD
jgi:S1-C subfamily serine protease